MKQTKQNHLKRVLEYRLAPIISGVILLLLFFITLIPSVKSRAANATIDLDMYGISLTSANPNATATIKTDKLSIYQDTIHTDTASPSGYRLYVSSPDHSNTIYLNDDPVNSTEPNEKFVATAGTFDVPSALEESTWGYAVAGLNQFDASYDVDNPDQNAKFAAVPLKDEEQLIRTYVGVSTDDTLDVYIGYKTAYRQATGEYSTRLLYTSLSDATSLAVEEAIVTDGSTVPAGYTTDTISIQTSLNTSRTLGDILVTVGNKICDNVTIIKESPLAVTCDLPILTAGNYDIVVNIPRLGKSYAILNGFTVVNPTATITIDTESEWFGAVSQTSVQADYGSTITISGNTITIGDTNVTAIETPDTAVYTYTFDKWTNNCGDKLVADCKIIASFTRTLTDHTISFVANPENYGTVSPTNLIASYGSDIAIAENTIKINEQTITATPAATTDQYSYTFIDWTNGCGDTVMLECTITANFSRALRQYTITWNAGTNALVTPTQTVKNYGETLGELPIPTSTDPELVFVGWFTSTSENREQIDENTIVTGSVTYYAIWQSKTAKVILGTNGNLNFVHDINNYNEGETYTDNLGETTVVKKYDLPGKNVSFNSIPWINERASILSVNFDDSFASVHPTTTAYWFYQVEKVASFTNLKNLKMDQVTSMEYMFCNAGYDAENFSLDVSTWDTSNVTTMRYLFSGAGRNASTWTITGLKNWDMHHVSNIAGMFYQAGYKANEFILDTSGWDMTSASYATSMFEQSGYSAQTYIIDVSNWNATKISNTTKMFASSGHDANTYKIIGIDKWTTSSFAVLDYMFTGAGHNATTWTIGELDDWDVSHVTSMNYTFGDNSSTNPPAYKATSFTLGDLSNWDVSKVVHMNGTFAFAGYNADDWYIGDLSNWIVSSVTELGGTFRGAGGTNPNWSIGDLSNWDVSNVTVTYNLFEYSGRYATRWYVGDLGKWNVSKATNMLCMFSQAGMHSEDFNTGNLSNWNVGSVTNFWSMFSYAGYYANTWSIGDLSGWNTGSVTNFGSMFTESGYNASSWFIGDISNWNTSSATDMDLMFKNAGYHSNTWAIGDISGWDTSSVTNMYMMFNSAGYNADYYMDIHSWNVENVTNHEYFDSGTGEKILSPWDPIPGPKAILGANGNLNFVYDDLKYIVGNTYTDNLGSTKITAVYDVPVNSHSYTDIAWFQNNNVTSVNFDSTFYTFHPVSTVYWFYADKNLSSVTNAQNLHTSSIIDMSHMFRSAGSGVDTWSIDGLGGWDTSAVTSMAYMFEGAGSGAANWSLNGIDNWNTSAVTDMSGMFWNAGQNATSWSIANISSWDTSSVTKMSSMFANAGLNANYYLDLSGWNVEKVIGHTNFDANVDEKILSPWDQ